MSLHGVAVHVVDFFPPNTVWGPNHPANTTGGFLMSPDMWAVLCFGIPSPKSRRKRAHRAKRRQRINRRGYA